MGLDSRLQPLSVHLQQQRHARQACVGLGLCSCAWQSALGTSLVFTAKSEVETVELVLLVREWPLLVDWT